MKFCKVFETTRGQVLAVVSPGERGEPAIRMMHMPEPMEMATLFISFDMRGGWPGAFEGLEALGIEEAQLMADRVHLETAEAKGHA